MSKEGRFKVGDRVCRPEYWGNKVLIIREIGAAINSRIIEEIDKCPIIYFFEDEDTSFGAWDYQLIYAEVYNSFLYQAMTEE